MRENTAEFMLQYLRMLYCPRRLPVRASKWLEGGTVKVFNWEAAVSISSFRVAKRWMSWGNRREN